MTVITYLRRRGGPESSGQAVGVDMEVWGSSFRNERKADKKKMKDDLCSQKLLMFCFHGIYSAFFAIFAKQIGGGAKTVCTLCPLRQVVALHQFLIHDLLPEL